MGTASAASPTATALAASPNPQLCGSAVTFTATVTPVSGTGIPTGNVVFSIDEVSVATVALDANGKAAYSTSGLPSGAHYILASYAGNSTYASSGHGLTETINPIPAPAPVFSPPAGTCSSPQLVTLSDAITGAAIYYTTDGSTPTTASTTYNPNTPIPVNSTETLKAVALATNYLLSPVATATYTMATATAGGASFTLTVNGAGFTPTSLVLWNGALRATTYVSGTQLTATILAADIAKEATNLVTVTNLSPTQWTSSALPFVVVSATPVAAISAASISDVAGSSGTHTLTLTGTDFIASSTVQWKGTSLATVYAGPWKLSATITSAQYASLPTPAVLTVSNPAGPSPGFELR